MSTAGTQDRRRGRAAVGPIVALAATLLGGCPGQDESDPDEGGDPDPVAEVGLDARVSNTSCLAGPRPLDTPLVRLGDALAVSASDPVALLQAPGDADRWFVVEQRGRVLRYEPGAGSAAFADLRQSAGGPVRNGGEMGLLGMAFHPGYADNRFVFLSYTGAPIDPGTGAPTSYVVRYTANPDGASLDTSSALEIIRVTQTDTNHNGGHIAFGDDGLLYIGLGDGGGSGDPGDDAQDVDNLLGAMLRIDVDIAEGAPRPYAIPADNPFAGGDCTGASGCPEIYAWGLRNPWRWSFDRDTGDLWLGDVGQGRFEEIDRVRRGGNYGWRCFEGEAPFNENGCAGGASFEPPLLAYAQDPGGHCAVVGGYVYRGTAIPELAGSYLYGDYCSGQVWRLSGDAEAPAAEPLLEAGSGITAFGEGHDRELYVIGPSNGIFPLLPGAAPAGGGAPVRLSDSGCVRADAPALPAPGLVPYALNAPFWSDGAAKERWVALPDEGAIDIAADGDWSFPVGTVLMKHFRLGGALVETRLFMRHDDGEWAGYSYEWDADGRDATRVDGGRTRLVQGRNWRYPSAGECLRCHTEAAGRSLGLETAQMNRPFDYPAPGRRAWQLSTFDALGLFSAPLGGAPDSHPRLADPADATGDRAARARAYLHVNCAQCHRPDGPTPVDIDFRFATALADMQVCRVAPTRGDVGLVDPRRLAPGEPERSEMLERMRRRDAVGMPPLASASADSAGVTLIGSWIAALQACR